MKEVYLGDGLYASFDGSRIILRTGHGNGDHWVRLDPEAYAALLDFVDRVKREARWQSA